MGCGSSLISLIHERIAPDFKRKDFSVHYCKNISSDIYSMYHCEKIKRIQTISHTKVKTETSGYTALETVTLQWNKYININIATGAQKYFRKPLSLNIVPHPLMQLETVLWLKEEVICQLHRALYARVHLRRTERLCHCVLCTDKSTFPCFWKTALSSLCQWWKQLSRLLSAKNAKGSVMIQRSISDNMTAG